MGQVCEKICLELLSELPHLDVGIDIDIEVITLFNSSLRQDFVKRGTTSNFPLAADRLPF